MAVSAISANVKKTAVTSVILVNAESANAIHVSAATDVASASADVDVVAMAMLTATLNKLAVAKHSHS